MDFISLNYPSLLGKPHQHWHSFATFCARLSRLYPLPFTLSGCCRHQSRACLYFLCTLQALRDCLRLPGTLNGCGYISALDFNRSHLLMTCPVVSLVLRQIVVVNPSEIENCGSDNSTSRQRRIISYEGIGLATSIPWKCVHFTSEDICTPTL
jgi:hypothetical protein